MEVEFYDVKERKKITLTEGITKTKYVRKLKDGSEQVRFAFRGLYNGRKLTKFCSQEAWNNAAVPEEN